MPLTFLSAFLRRHSITQSDAAERLGLSRQALVHWFTVDDTKLSNACALVEAYGCRLELSYEVTLPGLDYRDESTPNYPPEYDTQRLGFLRKALDDADFSVQDLAGLLGIGKTTLFDALRSDDIMVSRLFDIARLTGWTLRIRIVDASC
ncbi:MAG: helix-turn-helix domain-containing protein [Candidatus Cryptobacteroides sp.]